MAYDIGRMPQKRGPTRYYDANATSIRVAVMIDASYLVVMTTLSVRRESTEFGATPAIFSFACSRSNSQWCSFTIPSQTIAAVETKTIQAPIANAMLDQSNSREDSSSDIRGPLLGFAVAVSVAIISTASIVAAFVYQLRRKRRF
jgi:hypothetical protein